MGGGSIVTASGLLFGGDPDRNFLAIDAKSLAVLKRFQTGFGADAPAVLHELDGVDHVAIAAGGNSLRTTAMAAPYGFSH